MTNSRTIGWRSTATMVVAIGIGIFAFGIGLDKALADPLFGGAYCLLQQHTHLDMSTSVTCTTVIPCDVGSCGIGYSPPIPPVAPPSSQGSGSVYCLCPIASGGTYTCQTPVTYSWSSDESGEVVVEFETEEEWLPGMGWTLNCLGSCPNEKLCLSHIIMHEVGENSPPETVAESRYCACTHIFWDLASERLP